MSLVTKLGYSFLGIVTLGGGGTTIALSTNSSIGQESPSSQTLLIEETPSEMSHPASSATSSHSETTPENAISETQGYKSLEPASKSIEQEENGNCQIINFSSTSNIPETFNVTEQDYFSVICRKEVESILPEDTWTGFFPKNIFEINEEISKIDIKIEDLSETEVLDTATEEDEEWYGIKISSSKLKGNKALDSKLTYYSEDSSWAEVESASLDKKIYLLLIEDEKEERE